jgi:8-hydroxy-5-deazaflavin:NADPH oxidoreductase
MKIGTLGSGIMTAALVPHWIAAGHDVMIGGRNPEHAHSLAEQLGANAGSLADAARFGDVILLAVRSEGLAETIDACGASSGLLSGKIVIDCGNAVYLPDFSQVRWDGRSLAEQFEFHAIGSRVVKAFNLCEASVWRTPATYGGHPLKVPFCGEEEAKRIVAPLMEAVGVESFDIGDLSQARHLEAMAIVMIQALRNGTPARSAFNLVPADA